MKNFRLICAVFCFVLGGASFASEIGHLGKGELGKDWCSSGHKGWNYDGKTGVPFGGGTFICAQARCVPRGQIVLYTGRIFNFSGATPNYNWLMPKCCSPMKTPPRCTGPIKDGERECQESAECS